MTEYFEELVLEGATADGRDGLPRVLVLGGDVLALGAEVNFFGALTHQRRGRFVVDTDEAAKAGRAE